MAEYTGLYRGAVHDINDPESRGRLRALVPAVLGEAASGWAEPMLPASAEVAWSVGDRVWLMFEDGDLNRPVYQSRMVIRGEDLDEGVIDTKHLSEDVLVAVDSTDVVRDVTPPWPDGATGHERDKGFMWFDTTPEPGPELSITSAAITANVATIVTTDNHGVTVGSEVTVLGVDSLDAPSPVFDGTFVVASTPDSVTLTYATVASSNVAPFTPPENSYVQGLATGAPRNRPHIWDGTTWVDVQDTSILLTQSLLGGARSDINTHEEHLTALEGSLRTVRNTATTANEMAHTADGRISISDYEPRPEDAGTKNEGSLWITRTRERRNYCTNPSFEVDLSGWSVTGATPSLVSIDPVADDEWAVSLTNGAGAGHVTWVGTAPGVPVSEGEEWTVSGFIALSSGSGIGCSLTLEFVDATDTLVASYQSEPVDVALEQYPWPTPVISAQVPQGADFMRARFTNPNPNAVWLLDAVLVELAGQQGRYFDGDSPGGSWLGTPNASESRLDGGAIMRLFELANGTWVEKFWTADTIKSVYAGAIRGGTGYVRPPDLDFFSFDGALLGDNTVPVDKMVAPVLSCSEVVTAGDLVNIWNNNGVSMVRRAKAEPGYQADGFVLDSATLGGVVRVYTYGYNPLATGLSAGPLFVSATPGQTSSTPSKTKNTILQKVGFSVSPTTMVFTPSVPVTVT